MVVITAYSICSIRFEFLHGMRVEQEARKGEMEISLQLSWVSYLSQLFFNEVAGDGKEDCEKRLLSAGFAVVLLIVMEAGDITALCSFGGV